MAEKGVPVGPDRRDLDMANVSDSLTDLGDKTAGSPGGNIGGGSGGVQGRAERSNPKEAHSPAHEESRAGRKQEKE